ncbi:thioesterase family protein [Halomonas garicola]
MSAYYRLIDNTMDAENVVTAHYAPNHAAQGAWNAHEQHMAPATGVICAEIEKFLPRSDLRIGRIHLDIWGVIWFSPFTIQTRIIRPGRTIELIESRMEAEGRTCIIATCWRMKISNTQEISSSVNTVTAHPDKMQGWNGMQQWGGGFIESIIFKIDKQEDQEIIWLKNDLNMIEGKETSSFVHIMGMVDTANGVANRITADDWIFPNVDLNINLLRLPQGRWLGINATQEYGVDGIGLTSSILYDEFGMFGRSEQTLTIRRINKYI